MKWEKGEKGREQSRESGRQLKNNKATPAMASNVPVTTCQPKRSLKT